MHSKLSLFSMRYLVGALALLGLGCEPLVVGNGKMVTTHTEVPSFIRVEVGGDVALTITEGELSTLTLTGEENMLPHYEVVVRDDRLVIQPKLGGILHQTKQIAGSITVPRLEGIEASGASEATAGAMVSATEVRLSSSGASKIKAGPITAPTVEVGTTGASAIETQGTTSTFRVSASGASTVVAPALTSERLELSVSGSAKVNARASREVKGSASGAAKVVVEGAPPVREVSTSGSSSLTFP